MSLPFVSMNGNLVDEPELRYTPAGHPVVRFRVAASERVRDQQSGEWKDGDSCFLTVEVWRKQAENIAETLHKGTNVTVTGRLRQRSYDTREGEKRTVYEVKGDDVSVSLARQQATVQKVSGDGNGGGNGGGQSAAQSSDWGSAPAAAAPAGNGGGPAYDPPF